MIRGRRRHHHLAYDPNKNFKKNRLLMCRLFPHQHHRCQSTARVTNTTTTCEARTLLGIPTHAVLEMAAVRKAYFAAAKQCHPDTKSTSDEEDDGYERFLQVTDAYELLAAQLCSSPDKSADGSMVNTIIIPKSEEESFRYECHHRLGLSAEIVEECKTNTSFRQWLLGNTDSAYLWRDFLMQHGGLAPRLNSSSSQPIREIAAGDGNGETLRSHQRRKRRR
jgi:DnaJ domain